MQTYKVQSEAHMHGQRWGKLYKGYFSDRDIARDYVAAILRVARKAKPSAILDLGGGTGFILKELVRAGIAPDTRLINMDESEAQLAEIKDKRIIPKQGTLQSFRRTEIVGRRESLMMICRSVLQYGGIWRQKPWLRHLRRQLKPGEWFVHQSGCSDDLEAVLAVDVLFELAGVDKWVPYRDAFLRLLRQAGFVTTEDFPMPPVDMPSSGLVVRYHLSRQVIARIEDDLRRHLANRPDLFSHDAAGFSCSFPYRVFVCRAAAPRP